MKEPSHFQMHRLKITDWGDAPDEIIVQMKHVWLENRTKENAKRIIRELKWSNSSIEKHNRAHRDFHKFVRSL